MRRPIPWLAVLTLATCTESGLRITMSCLDP